jgi:hypothetical protein
VACNTNFTCSGGTCACKAPFTKCSGACTDVQSDPNNCGQCGTACPAGQSCTAGACT